MLNDNYIMPICKEKIFKKSKGVDLIFYKHQQLGGSFQKVIISNKSLPQLLKAGRNITI